MTIRTVATRGRTSSSVVRAVCGIAASVAAACAVLGHTKAQTLSASPTTFINYESPQTNPIRLTPNGKRLLAVDTPDARLSVFDVVTDPQNPRLLAEIPVAIEPISVTPRTDDEVWVVSQLSDNVSVVSLSQGIVTDTIPVKDDPADVVFAGGRAFVSASGSSAVRVFDVTTHAQVASIPLLGVAPRAMAISADGSKVYVAFALSGNRTTIIPANLAPAQPPPTNTSLPAPPKVGLIVDATDPQWNPSVIKYTMPDNDVAEIDAASLTVTRYFPRLGTVNLGLAVRPGSGDLYVANTDARNLVRFEPNVRGHLVDNRVTRVAISTGAATPIDLNPGLDYSQLPNLSAKATALAQPTAVTFDPSGSTMYVAAFGTDRVARLDAAGNVLARTEIALGTPPTGADSRNKRGPRGLALNYAGHALYVLNRISNTLSTVDTTTDAVVREQPAGGFDPTPAVIRQGRGFLYDARLSGNGMQSCAACHIDGENDHLAWDLGDPGGQMASVVSNGLTFQFHPMKGPMTTQTLRGLNTLEPFHWRADRADFTAFNGAFASLMGGSMLATADMNAYRDFVNTIAFPANPNLKLDGSLPATLGGGDPLAGRNTYLNEQYQPGLACNTCHAANPGPGTNRIIIPAQALQESQSFKVPQLRSIYNKLRFTNGVGSVSLDGYGLVHDGSITDLQTFLSAPVFGVFSTDTVRKRNLNAFVQCFDTGTAPAVGYARTITPAKFNDSGIVADWATMEAQAAGGRIDLIVKGTLDGSLHGLVYRPATNDYATDQPGYGPFTRAALSAKVQLGDTLTFMGVPTGAGVRMGVDRNNDGLWDGVRFQAVTGPHGAPGVQHDPSVGEPSL